MGGGSRRFGADLAARTAKSLYLRQALFFLVDAHGDELDDRFRDAKTTLEFQYYWPAGLDGHQDVITVVELANEVGEFAATHLVDVLDHAAAVGDVGGEARDQLVDVFFGHIGPNDEHNLI